MPATATIIRPPTGFEKKARIMARAKFLRLVRHMGFAREQYGFHTRFVCHNCDKPVGIQRGSGLVLPVESAGTVNVKKDAFILTCGCTNWTVR